MSEEKKILEEQENNFQNKPEKESQASFLSTPKGKLAVISGSVLLVLIAVSAWFLTRNSEEERPVPPPRNMSFDDENDTVKIGEGEQKITLSDEQLQAANLKIEKVGEALSKMGGTATSTGVVKANDYAQTPVVSLVGGVVREISVELGQNVQRGQTIALIQSDELAEAQSKYLSKLSETDEANKRYQRALKLAEIASESRDALDEMITMVRTSEAELIEYKSNFERTKKLLAIGAASRLELEQATTKVATAQAKLDEAKKRLDRARSLLTINPARRDELDRALTQLRSTEAETSSAAERLLVLGLSLQRINSLRITRKISSNLPITSPVSGTITERMINNGEIIMANKELMKVTNLSTVWVIGQVYEKDSAKIRVGSGANITSDAYPKQVFRGQISYIDPNLDQNTRTAQVRVELPNTDQKFKVGMYVSMAFANLGNAENTVPVVPKDAVQSIGNRQVVFIAIENPNIFILKPIKLGVESEGLYPVLEGLNVGDNIVTQGSFMLRAEWMKTHPSGF
jgi:RND family efflux transporter MFP subunit